MRLILICDATQTATTGRLLMPRAILMMLRRMIFEELAGNADDIADEFDVAAIAKLAERSLRKEVSAVPLDMPDDYFNFTFI